MFDWSGNKTRILAEIGSATAALLGLLFVALAASAATDWPAYEDIDVNQDGKIDALEAELVAGLDFLTADMDQDGALSREEFAMAANAPAPPSALVVE